MSEEDEKAKAMQRLVRMVDEWTVGSLAIQINPKENPGGAEDLKHMAAALEKQDMNQADLWKGQFIKDLAKNPPPVKDHDGIIRRVEAWGSAAAVRDMKGVYAAEAKGNSEEATRLLDAAFMEIGAHVLSHDKPLTTPAAVPKSQKNTDAPGRK